jgi:hypothetical protein
MNGAAPNMPCQRPDRDTGCGHTLFLSQGGDDAHETRSYTTGHSLHARHQRPECGRNAALLLDAILRQHKATRHTCQDWFDARLTRRR